MQGALRVIRRDSHALGLIHHLHLGLGRNRGIRVSCQRVIGVQLPVGRADHLKDRQTKEGDAQICQNAALQWEESQVDEKPPRTSQTGHAVCLLDNRLHITLAGVSLSPDGLQGNKHNPEGAALWEDALGLNCV